jgi:hypothetical protein
MCRDFSIFSIFSFFSFSILLQTKTKNKKQKTKNKKKWVLRHPGAVAPEGCVIAYLRRT